MPAEIRPGTACLVDPAQEARFRATQLPGLRRDAHLVFSFVLAYNVVFFVVNSLRGVWVTDHVVMVAGCLGGLLALRRCRTWSATTGVLLAGAVVYTVVSLGLAQDRSPTGWVLLSVHSAAVLYLHARLPFAVTVWLAPCWSVLSLSAGALAGVVGIDLVMAAGFLLVLNGIGLSAAHRVATQSRLLFARTEALELLSTTDPLTGLANRRAWATALDLAWSRCARDDVPVGVVLVDVDHFMHINDTHGHHGGDLVLAQLAHLLGDVARRPGDLAARLGGDEFGLLLPGADADAVAELTRRVLETTRQVREAAPPSAPTSCLSISVGATSARPGTGDGAQHAVATADAALYRAKDGGRDRVARG